MLVEGGHWPMGVFLQLGGGWRSREDGGGDDGLLGGGLERAEHTVTSTGAAVRWF